GLRQGGVGAPYDLVFLDPPYRQGLGEKALASLLAGDWLTPGAICVFERGSDELDPALPGYDLLDSRVYGAAKVLFLKRSAPAGN
ncbi:MAG: RsmD family RNA methyltransferase, partial [Caulobacteraceae bacterium]